MPTFFVNYYYLLNLGQHLGHSRLNLLYYNSWFIFGYRTGLALMDLTKSVIMYRAGFAAIKSSVFRRGPIWFVNLDAFIAKFVENSAIRCGEFFVTNYWIRGLVSNFRSMRVLFYKITHTNPLIWKRKEFQFDRIFLEWTFSRYRRPRVMFISSVYNSPAPARESIQGGVAALGIVDTNTQSYSVSIPIPGNDESVTCLAFYNDMISGYIMANKFKNVTSWFFKVRKARRLASFADWLRTVYVKESIKQVNIADLFTIPDFGDMLYRGFSHYTIKDYKRTIYIREFNLFYPDTFNVDLFSVYNSFLNKKTRILTFISFRLFSRMVSFAKLFKRSRNRFFLSFFSKSKNPRFKFGSMETIKTRFFLSRFSDTLRVNVFQNFKAFGQAMRQVFLKYKSKRHFFVRDLLKNLIFKFYLRHNFKIRKSTTKSYRQNHISTFFTDYLYSFMLTDYAKYFNIDLLPIFAKTSGKSDVLLFAKTEFLKFFTFKFLQKYFSFCFPLLYAPEQSYLKLWRILNFFYVIFLKFNYNDAHLNMFGDYLGGTFVFKDFSKIAKPRVNVLTFPIKSSYVREYEGAINTTTYFLYDYFLLSTFSSFDNIQYTKLNDFFFRGYQQRHVYPVGLINDIFTHENWLRAYTTHTIYDI